MKKGFSGDSVVVKSSILKSAKANLSFIVECEDLDDSVREALMGVMFLIECSESESKSQCVTENITSTGEKLID
ncbi:hypothetical protein [Pseudoalteromonas sp. Of7M-16]|uniref:hypothetical protein n=1 Tax=Pseudoalteromonas sp. Of7M-16 TaxID=2917756 RepID=UPI001EF69985|nr:hypothetical protein [Pseudoalteromonas sp. Of7M-16]MCG7551596.1 hypothetical protein [Pseudoalteromonas sp. Of7M-16]